MEMCPPVEGFIERGRGRVVSSAVVVEVVLPFCQKQRTKPPFGLGHKHIHKQSKRRRKANKRKNTRAGNQKEIGKLNHDRYGWQSPEYTAQKMSGPRSKLKVKTAIPMVRKICHFSFH
jgi:hypothetical protein